MISLVSESVIVHDDEDGYGETRTKMSICTVPADMPDAFVAKAVAEDFPATRCMHEHDCCGQFYADPALWGFIDWQGEEPVAESVNRTILVQQLWVQNV